MACFLAVTQSVACSPRGPRHSQHCLPGGVGCRSCRHHSRHSSYSPQLGDASHAHAQLPRQGLLDCRAGPWRRKHGTGAGGQWCTPTLVRRATNVSLPPGPSRALTRSRWGVGGRGDRPSSWVGQGFKDRSPATDEPFCGQATTTNTFVSLGPLYQTAVLKAGFAGTFGPKVTKPQAQQTLGSSPSQPGFHRRLPIPAPSLLAFGRMQRGGCAFSRTSQWRQGSDGRTGLAFPHQLGRVLLRS